MADRPARTKRRADNARSEQSQRFIRTARELGCDEDPEAFKRAVRKLAKAPPPAPRKRKKRDDDTPA
jgi:hypothetical protein